LVQTDEERKAKQKESQKKYNSRPEVKVKRKEYASRPEVKAKRKETKKKYNSTAKGKAKQKEYSQRPEARAKRKEYQSRPEARAKRKEYQSRPEVKAKASKRNTTSEFRAKGRILHNNERLKIFQAYSKRLSNSDIPCCNCCGLNSHIDFLAIDHIFGRVEMDSIPELVAIGYSSKLEGSKLRDWIMQNNFPDGFQILCHNCNFAKGFLKNNNTCPHETARKEETFAMMEEQSSFEV
jgi:hypothetical protein